MPPDKPPSKGIIASVMGFLVAFPKGSEGLSHGHPVTFPNLSKDPQFNQNFCKLVLFSGLLELKTDITGRVCRYHGHLH